MRIHLRPIALEKPNNPGCGMLLAPIEPRNSEFTNHTMFGFLKNILRKPRETAVESDRTSAGDSNGSSLSHYMPRTTPAGHSRPTSAPVSQFTSKGVEVSLRSIIENLPLELQPRVRQHEVGELMISVPLEKVLAQLSRGSVRISFYELRHAAPGVFSPEDDRDKVMVSLPLSEIIPRLNPALIQRRRVQKQVDVPSDINSPFDRYGQGLIFSIGPTKAEHGAPPAAVPPPRKNGSDTEYRNAPGRLSYSISHNPPSPPGLPVSPDRGNLVPEATPFPEELTPPTDGLPPSQTSAPDPAEIPAVPIAFKLPKPAAPVTPAKPTTSTSFHRPPATPPPQTFKLVPPTSPARDNGVPSPVPSAPQPPAQAPVPMATPIPMRPQPPAPAVAPAPVEAPAPASIPHAAPVAPIAKPASAKPAQEPLVVGLSSLAEAWPEEVRKEILSHRLVDAKVGLPYESVEQSLKSGRIVFSWKSLRGWLRPAMPAAITSPHDSMVLELPLHIVAPVFLERQRSSSKPQQKVDVDEDIPNLFFGFPQPAAIVGAGAGPEDTNFYVWDDTSDTAMVDRSAEKRQTPGTKFVAKYATPNEVVSRAAALEGVAGALIALPDGLMVASRLSPDMNGDTLAAFLPHIFGKVSQCTKELRMGELNNLNFTVGNIPWKIFRVNAIFFAAFGVSGQPLPTAQLAALAGDLNHKQR